MSKRLYWYLVLGIVVPGALAKAGSKEGVLGGLAGLAGGLVIAVAIAGIIEGVRFVLKMARR